jgi:hypothetical protein
LTNYLWAQRADQHQNARYDTHIAF